MPKMSRCSGGHVSILRPSPPIEVRNENSFLPLFQAKRLIELSMQDANTLLFSTYKFPSF